MARQLEDQLCLTYRAAWFPYLMAVRLPHCNFCPHRPRHLNACRGRDTCPIPTASSARRPGESRAAPRVRWRWPGRNCDGGTVATRCTRGRSPAAYSWATYATYATCASLRHYALRIAAVRTRSQPVRHETIQGVICSRTWHRHEKTLEGLDSDNRHFLPKQRYLDVQPLEKQIGRDPIRWLEYSCAKISTDLSRHRDQIHRAEEKVI
jgi:hypothetical protein